MKKTIKMAIYGCTAITLSLISLDASQLQAGFAMEGGSLVVPEVKVTNNITVTNPYGTHYLKQAFFNDKLTLVDREIRTTQGDGFRIIEMLSSNSIQLVSEQENVNLFFRYISPGYYYIQNINTGEKGYYRTSQVSDSSGADVNSWHADILNFVEYEEQRSTLEHLLLKNTTDGPQVCGLDRPGCEWLDVTGPVIAGASMVITCAASYATLGALVASCGGTTFGFVERMRSFRNTCAGCEATVTVTTDNDSNNNHGSGGGSTGGGYLGGTSNYNSTINHSDPLTWTCHSPYYVDTNPYDNEIVEQVSICGMYGF